MPQVPPPSFLGLGLTPQGKSTAIPAPASPLCSSDPSPWCPPDPYVKVWLMYKDKRVEKKKTVTMKRNLNPIFNESFAFDIPTEKLRETTIIITVMDKDKLSRNDVIGKVGGLAGAPDKDVSLKGAAGVVSEHRAGQQEGEGVSLFHLKRRGLVEICPSVLP